MSILIRFTPDSLTAEQYDETVRQLSENGQWPPDGLEYHVCFGAEGKLRVSEVWSSRELCDAFGERLMPVLANAGIEPGEPEFLDVHNTIAG